jgi:hypothetical protein
MSSLKVINTFKYPLSSDNSLSIKVRNGTNSCNDVYWDGNLFWQSGGDIPAWADRTMSNIQTLITTLLTNVTTLTTNVTTLTTNVTTLTTDVSSIKLSVDQLNKHMDIIRG